MTLHVVVRDADPDVDVVPPGSVPLVPVLPLPEELPVDDAEPVVAVEPVAGASVATMPLPPPLLFVAAESSPLVDPV